MIELPAPTVECVGMNISVNAFDERRVQNLWSEYQRALRPPKQPGELRLYVDVGLPMHGPDVRNCCHFPRVPDDFVHDLKKNGIEYSIF
jgi:hypothetical protein